MANDGWGSKWPVLELDLEIAKERFSKVKWPSDFEKDASEAMNKASNISWPKPDFIGWDKGTNDKTTIAKIADGKIAYIGELKLQGSNLVDDRAYLYFQCESCGEILDPHTKSFQSLQESRVNAGWKCVWNLAGMGYKVYCAKCGDKV